MNFVELLGPEPVTGRFTGEPEAGARTPGEVLWFEVDHGHVDPDGRWLTWVTAWHTRSDLQLTLDDGRRFELPWRSMRLAIPATDTRRFAGDEADCPPPLAEWVANNGGPVTVAEYALLANQPYALHATLETYLLPPGEPGGPPHRAQRSVVRVSWPNSRGTLTPLYLGWSG